MNFKEALCKRIELDSLISTKKIAPNYDIPSNTNNLKGGVNKKYNPDRHEVITMKNSARQDYINEDKVKRSIENFLFTPSFLEHQPFHIQANFPDKDNINKLFFSFQETIEYDLSHSKCLTDIYPGRDYKQDVRVVSVYKDMFSNDDFQKLKFGSSIKNTIPNSDAMNLEQISFCIHQLIYAHFVLFENKIMHGDMHMNNIKWLPCTDENSYDDQTYAILKIFDFGHAKFNCHSIHGGSRFNDLQYLFEFKSQKPGLIGFFEGRSRNKDLEKMYQSNDIKATKRMAKHYPILFFMSLVRRTRNLITLQEDISTLKGIGKKLETKLRTALKNESNNKNENANKKLAIFEEIANDIFDELENLAYLNKV